jgi:hypothetical protein
MDRIFDLTATPHQAFMRGFWRGLAAPLAVFSMHNIPDWAQPPVLEVRNPAKGSAGLAGDFRRVGDCLRAAVDRYHG